MNNFSLLSWCNCDVGIFLLCPWASLPTRGNMCCLCFPVVCNFDVGIFLLCHWTSLGLGFLSHIMMQHWWSGFSAVPLDQFASEGVICACGVALCFFTLVLRSCSVPGPVCFKWCYLCWCLSFQLLQHEDATLMLGWLCSVSHYDATLMLGGFLSVSHHDATLM